ncbi:hypothetical protein N790_01385 [Arenimonas malthae CC-JY-1]|uniref:Uncharacterized protein n=1 Tax=Arenimonas malthae CC-JY-1 TaxID=1384054 RepID=A0A091BCH2_9GAMM|nr:hypothetical protein N790_01385 [Arenimonas malthae CC-JY-1]
MIWDGTLLARLVARLQKAQLSWTGSGALSRHPLEQGVAE